MANRAVAGGLFLLVVSLPIVLLLIRALPATGLARWTIVPLPSLFPTFDLFPSFDGGPFDATSWLWDLLVDFLRLTFAVVYYVVLAIAVLGASLVLAGSVALSDPRSIRRSIVRTLEFRLVQGLLAAYSLLGVALVFPAVFRGGLELVLLVSLWFVLFFGLQAHWRGLETREDWVGRIGLWYPLTVAIFVLPMAVVGIASTTLRPWFLSMTQSLTTPGLESAVLAWGPTDPLRGYGVLAGVTYAGFWLAAVFGLGWSVGVLTEAVARGAPRIASVARRIRRRVARLASRTSRRD